MCTQPGLVLFYTGLIVLGLERPAHAYVDPGSIAILVQVLVAGLGGAIITFRRYLLDLFHRLTGMHKPPKK